MFAQNIHKPPKLYGAGGKYGGSGYGLGSVPIKPEPSALEQLAAVAPEGFAKVLKAMKQPELAKLAEKLGIHKYAKRYHVNSLREDIAKFLKDL